MLTLQPSDLRPASKNRSLWIPTLKPSQIRSFTLKWCSFRRHCWNQVNSIPTLNKANFDASTQNDGNLDARSKEQVYSDSYTEVQSISIAAVKSSQLWCRNTKTKVITVPTLKPRIFKFLHQNLVNLDPCTEIKSSSIQTPKPSHFEPRTTDKSISMPILKSC